MKRLTVAPEVLTRLLDPADPALQAKVLTDLLDYPTDDSEVAAARDHLNGKMHADLDRNGRPSPWITYRCLLAFKRFGLLELPGQP